VAQEHDIPNADALQKLSGTGFIVGSILIVIGSLWLPTIDLSHVLRAQQQFGEQAVRLQICALLITFGYWAIMLGTAGLYSSITATGSAWARLGFYFHIVGVVLWTLGMSLDVSYSVAIVNWMTSPAAAKEVAYSVVTVLSPAGFGRGLFPMNVMVNWLAFAFLGVGMALSAIYPRWLGWSGLILGMAGVLLGISMTFTGRERLFTPFIILWGFTILWWLMTGIWTAGRAWQRRHPEHVIGISN
jgi:hypothetical protein